MMRPTARPVDRTADARERPTERPNDEAPSANPHSSTTERRDVLARGATRRDHPRRPNPRSREDKTAGIREIALGRDDACLASLLRAKTRVLRGRATTPASRRSSARKRGCFAVGMVVEKNRSVFSRRSRARSARVGTARRRGFPAARGTYGRDWWLTTLSPERARRTTRRVKTKGRCVPCRRERRRISSPRPRVC